MRNDMLMFKKKKKSQARFATCFFFAYFFKLIFQKNSTMQVFKKIGVGSAAKVYGLTLGLLGIFFGVIYALLFSFIGSFSNEEIPMAGAGLGIFMLILIPIVYGILGFIIGALGAFIYNFVAKKFGGLEIEFSEPNPFPAD